MTVPHLRKFGTALGVMSSLLFAGYAIRKARSIESDLLYTRDIYTAWLAILRGLRVIFEEHEVPRRKAHRWMRRQLFRSRNLLGVVFISHSLEAWYKASGLLEGTEVRTLVASDAASLSQVRPLRPVSDAGNRRLVVGYVGSFLRGRGIELILSIAEELPQFQFKLIGGTSEQLPRTSWPPPVNVECCGFAEPGQVSVLFDGIDVLVMPYQNGTTTRSGAVSAQWMSPLKMFEYMASSAPLIASDLPVLREVLVPEHNCLMVPPDDVDAWALAIQRLCGDPELRNRLARNARDDIVQTYNWPSRARVILGHLLA